MSPRSLQIFFWSAVVFVMTAPFEIVLAAHGGDGNSYYRYLRYGLALFPLLTLGKKLSETVALVRRSILLIGAIALPAVLILFSRNLSWSVTQYAIYFATVITAMGVAVTFDARETISVMMGVFALTIGLSLVMVFLFPIYGISQVGDLVGQAEAGFWRGVCIHKNTLGHIAGISFVGAVIAGKRVFRHVLLAAPLVLGSLACMIFSHCSSAYVLAFAGIASFVAIRTMRFSAGRWIIVPSVVLFGAGAAYLYLSGKYGFILELFGKDETLSGRSDIWADGIALAKQVWMFGAGFGYTSAPEIQQWLFENHGITHFHNAYLELIINLGLIGSSLFIAAAVLGIGQLIKIRSWSDETLWDRDVLLALLITTFVSGMSEPMLSRPVGPVSLSALVLSFSLLGMTRTSPQEEQYYPEYSYAEPELQS